MRLFIVAREAPTAPAAWAAKRAARTARARAARTVRPVGGRIVGRMVVGFTVVLLGSALPSARVRAAVVDGPIVGRRGRAARRQGCLSGCLFGRPRNA